MITLFFYSMTSQKYFLSQPTVCIIAGVAGSGKSTLGKEIAQRLINSTLLSKDLIQNAFTEKERDGELYGFISGPTARVLLSFVDVQLSHGKIPLIDAPFSFNHQRTDEFRDWVSHFRKIAEKHHARLAIIRCLPPSEEELKKRIKERGYVWDQWKLDHWQDFLKRDPLDFPIPHNDVYELITTSSSEELAEHILKEYLKANSITLINDSSPPK